MIIEVKENEILTEWWTSKDDEDGKKQSTKETVYAKNKGRTNETTMNMKFRYHLMKSQIPPLFLNP
jgi:hypothetical protein